MSPICKMADNGRLTVDQKVKVVLFYAETKSVVATQRRFRAHFRTRWAPCKQTIYRLEPVHTPQTEFLISCMRRLIFWCHIGFLNFMRVANCGRLIARILIHAISFMGILERESIPKEARKCTAAQVPHCEVVPRDFWRLVSKSCDECKGSFIRGCEAKRWSHWTCFH